MHPFFKKGVHFLFWYHARVCSNLKITDELHMKYPDTFHVMDEKKKENSNLMTGDDFVGLSDPEAHMIVTVGYRANTRFAAKDMAKNMEKQIAMTISKMIFAY